MTRIAIAAAAAGTLTQERWIPVLEAIPHRRRRSGRRRIEMALRAFFGARVARESLTEISAKHRQARARELLLYAVDATGKWEPSILLRGGQRLEQALAGGRGAILWCDSFVFRALVGKRALFDNDFCGYQLSLHNHGYSRSRLGRTTLNVFQQRQESKYARRLAFDHGDPPAAARLIFERLRRGDLVLITNNLATPSQVMEMPFGQRGRLRLATGPVQIARACRVPLLPFAMFELEPYRLYEGVVGDEIASIGTAGNENDLLSVANAMINYRKWLEPHLQRFPEQWMRWPSLVSRDADESEAG